MAYTQGQKLNTLPALGNRMSPTLTPTGNPLVFVDMPEVIYSGVSYFGTAAVSYRDTVNGSFCLMYYHQNRYGSDLYYCIAFSNESSTETAHVYWSKQGYQENTDAAILGKDMTKQWLNSSGTELYWGSIAPGKTKYFTIRKVDNTYTGSAMFDFRVTSQLTASIVISPTYPSPNDPTNGINNSYVLGLSVLPWVETAVINNKTCVVGITRGKWEYNKLTGTINYQGTTGNGYVTLGNDSRQSVSPWLTGELITGYSAVDGIPVTNWGNYGVEYDMTVNVTNPWPGYSKMDTIYFDILQHTSSSYYCYFSGKVNGTTRTLEDQFINSNTKGWVLDKRSPGSYSLSTMVCAGSNHPLGLLFVSDN